MKENAGKWCYKIGFSPTKDLIYYAKNFEPYPMDDGKQSELLKWVLDMLGFVVSKVNFDEWWFASRRYQSQGDKLCSFCRSQNEIGQAPELGQ